MSKLSIFLFKEFPVFLFIVLFFYFILKYFYPFFRPIWLKTFNSFRGFFSGKRKSRILRLFYLPSGKRKDLSLEERRKLQEAFNTELRALLNEELTRYDNEKKEKLTQITNKQTEITKILSFVNNRRANRIMKARENFFGKVIYSLDQLFTKETAKNLMLLGGALILIGIDILIAVDIIESLGIIRRELVFLGLKIPLPPILGFFITIILALFLHIVIGPTLSFKEVKKRWIKIIFSVLIVFIVAALLLSMVFFPSKSSPIFELVLRIVWVIGVFAVYWLFGQICGEANDYFRIFVASIIILVPIIYIIFGLPFIFSIISGLVWDALSTIYLKLYNARLSKQEVNVIDEVNSKSNGMWRGMTS